MLYRMSTKGIGYDAIGDLDLGFVVTDSIRAGKMH